MVVGPVACFYQLDIERKLGCGIGNTPTSRDSGIWEIVVPRENPIESATSEMEQEKCHGVCRNNIQPHTSSFLARLVEKPRLQQTERSGGHGQDCTRGCILIVSYRLHTVPGAPPSKVAIRTATSLRSRSELGQRSMLSYVNRSPLSVHRRELLGVSAA